MIKVLNLLGNFNNDNYEKLSFLYVKNMSNA